MFGPSRLLVILAVITAILAIVSRFATPIVVLPDTWLGATAVLLLFSIALSLLNIGEAMSKKAS